MSSLKGGCGEGVKAAAGGRPVNLAQCPGDDGGGENADQDGASDFFDFKGDHEDQAEERECRGGISNVAETDEGCGIADDKAGVAKSNERDEQADAAGDRGVELMGD